MRQSMLLIGTLALAATALAGCADHETEAMYQKMLQSRAALEAQIDGLERDGRISHRQAMEMHAEDQARFAQEDARLRAMGNDVEISMPTFARPPLPPYAVSEPQTVPVPEGVAPEALTPYQPPPRTVMCVGVMSAEPGHAGEPCPTQ